MTRWIGLLLLTLTALAVMACSAPAGSASGAAAQGPAAGPRLDFDKRAFDFGRVAFNQTVEARFVAKNTGGEPLTIKDVSIKTVEGC